MTYDIIVRFPDKETADIYTNELAERGPNYFDFTPFLKEEGGPHGTAKYTETTETEIESST